VICLPATGAANFEHDHFGGVGVILVRKMLESHWALKFANATLVPCLKNFIHWRSSFFGMTNILLQSRFKVAKFD